MSSCASYVSHTHDIIDDVTRSQSRSNFEIDTSLSIFELEHRSKAQNVGNANAYLSDIINLQYNLRWKVCLQLKMAAILKKFLLLNTASIWPQIWKDHPKLCQKALLHDDVIDDVTGWPQNRPSIFLYKWNNNIFHDIYKTSEDIIIKLPVPNYHEIMTIFI